MGSHSLNNWPFYKPHVTVVDVLESGACLDGVVEWIKKHGGKIAGETATQKNPYIVTAANGDGSGSGYGEF